MRIVVGDKDTKKLHTTNFVGTDIDSADPRTFQEFEGETTTLLFNIRVFLYNFFGKDIGISTRKNKS